MADDELREAERAWGAAPDDLHARARYTGALRRAGRAAPAGLREVRSARTIHARCRLTLRVCTPDGRVVELRTAGDEEPLILPAHEWLEASVLTAEHQAGDRLIADLEALAPDRLELLFDAPEALRPFHALRPGQLTLASTMPRAVARAHDPPALGALDLEPFLHPGLTGLGLRSLRFGDLERLVAGAPALQALSLEVTRATTGEALAPLARLGGLRRLEVLRGANDGVHPLPRAPALAGLDRLEELSLCGLNLPGAELEALAGMRGLRRLTLDPIMFDGSGGEWLAGLAGLPLERLRVVPRLSSRAPVAAVLGLPLRALSLALDPLPGVAWFAGLPPGLEELAVDCDGELGWLDRLRALRTLRLDVQDYGLPSPPPSVDLAPLAAVTGLEGLSVTGRQPVRLDALAGLTALRRLYLRTFSEGTSVLEPLRRHPALDELYVEESRWTDAELAPLPDLPALRSLLVPYFSVTVETLALLRRCAALRELTMGRSSRITSAALAAFRADRPEVRCLFGGELYI